MIRALLVAGAGYAAYRYFGGRRRKRAGKQAPASEAKGAADGR